MSAKAVNWAWQIKDLVLNERLVMLVMAYYADDQNQCNLTEEEIAIGVSRLKRELTPRSGPEDVGRILGDPRYRKERVAQ